MQAADRTIDACVRVYACANNMAMLACPVASNLVFVASPALLVKAVARHVWLLSNFGSRFDTAFFLCPLCFVQPYRLILVVARLGAILMNMLFVLCVLLSLVPRMTCAHIN